MPFKKGETPKGARPFKKGKSGNPAGYPKGIPNRSTILKKWLAFELNVLNPITGGQEKLTVEDEVIFALITRARQGDIAAIREILDSTYGKLTDKHEITGETAVQITIIEPVKPNA
jgi:hypothetical protein